MAKTIVGLEITEASVRAVEVTRGRRQLLVTAGEVALPEGAARDSEILDPDVVAMAIGQLWSQAGIKSMDVVIGVANRRILVREHSSPAVRPEHLRAALPFEVQDLLPVPPDQAVLDFYPISASDGQVHGLLVAAVSENIETMITTLKRVKLRTAAVDFVPFGLARVSRFVAQPGQTVAVVAVGEHTTSLVVARDGIPQFARIIPLDLVTGTPQSPEVETTETGTGRPPAARRAIDADTIDQPQPAVGDLINRVRNTLSFHASRPGVEPVGAAYLTGPGVSAPGLLQLAGATLGVPVLTVDTNNLLPPGKGGPLDAGFALRLVPTLGFILGEEH